LSVDARQSPPRLDRSSFAAAFQESSRALWCIAAAITRDRSLAHDVVQEAAVVALRKLDEFDPATSFTAWAGQIVRFLALNERRKLIRVDVSEAGPAALESAADRRIDQAAPVESGLRGHLADALDSLDDTARACLLMKTVMDMGYKDIAAALGIPEGTAMSHVHRSRQTLRKKLTPHWEASGGAGA
jgi:RNA polymerase sigma-70 factor (ECF subfamily)